jgi:hypothetical protein
MSGIGHEQARQSWRSAATTSLAAKLYFWPESGLSAIV